MSQSRRSAHSFGHGIHQQHESDSDSEQKSPIYLAERELHSRPSINSAHPLDLSSLTSPTFTADVFQSDPQPRQSISSKSHTRVRRESVVSTRLMSISDDDVPNRSTLVSSQTKNGKRPLERSRGLGGEKSLVEHGFASLMDGSGSKDTVSDLLSKVTDNDIQKLMQLNMPLNHSKSTGQPKRNTTSMKTDPQNPNEGYGVENIEPEAIIEISEHTFALSQKCKDILSQKYNHIYEMISRTETYNPLQTLRDRHMRIQLAMERGGDPLPQELYYWYQQYTNASLTMHKDLPSEWYIRTEEMLNDYEWQKSHPQFKNEKGAMKYRGHDTEMSDSGSTHSSIDNSAQTQTDTIHHYIQHLPQPSKSTNSADSFDSPPGSPLRFQSITSSLSLRQKRPLPSPIRSSSHSQDSSPTGSPPPSPKARSSLRRHVKSNSTSSLPTLSTAVPQSSDFPTVGLSSEYKDVEGGFGNRSGKDKRASWGIINILKKKENERDHLKNYHYRRGLINQVSVSDHNVDMIDKRLQVVSPMIRSASNNSVNSDSSAEFSHNDDFIQVPSLSDYDYSGPQITEHVAKQGANLSFQSLHTQNSAVSQLPDAASPKKMKRSSKFGQRLQVPSRSRIDDTESEGMSNETRSPPQILSDEDSNNSIPRRFLERLRREKDKFGDYYDSDSSRGALSAIDNENEISYFDHISSPLIHNKIYSTSDIPTRDIYEDQKNIDEDSGIDSSEAARNVDAVSSEEVPIQRLIFNLNDLPDDVLTMIEKMRTIGKARDITKEQLIQNAKINEVLGAESQVADEEEEGEMTSQIDGMMPKFVEVEVSAEENTGFNKRIKYKHVPVDLHVTFLGNREGNYLNDMQVNHNHISQRLVVDYENIVSQYQRDIEKLPIEDFATEDNAESHNFMFMKTSQTLSGSPTEMEALDTIQRLPLTRKRADTSLLMAPFASLNSFAYTHEKLDENIQALDARLKECQSKLMETVGLNEGISITMRKSHEQFECMDQVEALQTLKQIEEEIQAIITARAQNPWQDAVYYVLSLLITGLALLFWLLAFLIRSIRKAVQFLHKIYLQSKIGNETTTRMLASNISQRRPGTAG